MTIFNRHERQEQIGGWVQAAFRSAHVAVMGSDRASTYLTWALLSMGVGMISWIGRPRLIGESLRRFLLASPSLWGGVELIEYPFDVEYGSELDWALGQAPPQQLAVLTEDPGAQQLALCWAERLAVPVVFGSTAGSGWFGAGPPLEPAEGSQDPVRAAVVAAVVADAVRERICPLPGGAVPNDGPLGLDLPVEPFHELHVLQVGLGAIGVYSAAILCALLGSRLTLRMWDFDHVESTNLNRQGLFTAEDARKGLPKAHAALRSLGRLFPSVRLSAEVSRLGPQDGPRIAALDPRPDVLLSAVDNAVGRLTIQEIGRELAIPVIQGGTSLFAADCFTQRIGGPTLDHQMHNALSEAAARERSVDQLRPVGGCGGQPSYVVPGLIAGALMAYRLTQLGRSTELPPLRWRSGGIPLETRSFSHAAFDLAEIGI